MIKKYTVLCGSLLFLCAPLGYTHAASKPIKTPTPPPLEISGWIPYWRTATGTADALAHLDTFTEINPFGYTVKRDGTLFDALHINDPAWQNLITAARAKKIRVIPTVMWGDTEAIHRILSKQKTRVALENDIAQLVKDNNFDGIDIDFEGKKAETKNYFSLFLKGMSSRIGKKWFMCTIEPRTPLDSRFTVIPKDIKFVNDFNVINTYCDRVRIMTYDQQSIDLKLNKAINGPYVPVADPKWVEKVITLAAQTISKKKLVIGIPTYGYEYQATPFGHGYSYNLLWAFNPRYATETAQQLNIIPQRNAAGELSFMYNPLSSTSVILTDGDRDGTQSNNPDLATTSFSAPEATSSPATSTPFRILWWSDAQAIQDKVHLAKKLGVRGIAIFKIDGGEDSNLWNILQ